MLSKVIFSLSRQSGAESCARAELEEAMLAPVTELLNHASVGAKDPERRSGRRKRVPPRSENPGLFSEKSGFERYRGQNAEAGPASRREFLFPCAGLPAPPLQ